MDLVTLPREILPERYYLVTRCCADWSGNEPTCVTHLVTLDDVFDKVVYTLANPAVDHLVDRVADWPGSSSFHHSSRVIRGSPEAPPRFVPRMRP